MPLPISNGTVEVGDLMALVADNAIGRFEGFGAGAKVCFRKESDNSLTTSSAPSAFRVLTAAELVTRSGTIALAEAQAAYDAAAAALTAAGGEPCPEEPE